MLFKRGWSAPFLRSKKPLPRALNPVGRIVGKVKAYAGNLIYMELVDLPEIDNNILGDFCLCPLVRQTIALKWY